MISLLLAASLPAAAAAATYYVSPSGSDSASGDSEAAAWQSLAAASARVNGGDTILLQRNGAWLNEVLRTPASGLTIGAFGASTLPAPLIQHGRGLNNNDPCLELHGDGLTISDVHISGCAGGLRISGGTLLRPASNTVVQRVFFADIRTPFLFYSPPNGNWAPALSLTGGDFANFTVQNCLAVRIDAFFSSKAEVHGMHLDSNTVQSCSGNCYNLGSGVDLLMENSVFLRDMSTRLFLYGTTDIIVGGLRGHNAVIDTDFNSRGEYQGAPDGCAFDFETGATGFEIRGNYFYRSCTSCNRKPAFASSLGSNWGET
jgi:hypothetical protein